LIGHYLLQLQGKSVDAVDNVAKFGGGFGGFLCRDVVRRVSMVLQSPPRLYGKRRYTAFLQNTAAKIGKKLELYIFLRIFFRDELGTTRYKYLTGVFCIICVLKNILFASLPNIFYLCRVFFKRLWRACLSIISCSSTVESKK
jgi:hypothetical protein